MPMSTGVPFNARSTIRVSEAERSLAKRFDTPIAADGQRRILPSVSCLTPRKARLESLLGSPTVALKPSQGVNTVRMSDISVETWASAKCEKAAAAEAANKRPKLFIFFSPPRDDRPSHLPPPSVMLQYAPQYCRQTP